MPSSVPGSGFKVYDILTRIIPGTVLVTSIPETFEHHPNSEFKYNLTDYLFSTPELFVMLGAGLVVGELIQASRTKFHPVPYPIRRLLYHQSKNRNFLSTHDRWKLKIWDYLSTGRTGIITVPISERTPFSLFGIPSEVETNAAVGFWTDFKRNFGLSDDFDRAADVYGLLVSYMEPRMSSDLERYRGVVDLASNLTISIAILLYFSVFTLPTIDNASQIIAVLAGLFLFSIPAILDFFGFLERAFSNRLLLEYLLARKEGDEEGNNSVWIKSH